MSKTLLIVAIACFAVQLVVAQSFNDQCVSAHNKYRKAHGVPNVSADAGLARFAQEWANHLASSNTFEHREDNDYGENLYVVYGSSSVSCDTAVTSWYNEIKFYNWGNPGFTMKTGHFTQVVWKDTQKIGCASATKGTNTYVVCNYDPSGNWDGEFAQNVPRAN